MDGSCAVCVGSLVPIVMQRQTTSREEGGPEGEEGAVVGGGRAAEAEAQYRRELEQRFKRMAVEHGVDPKEVKVFFKDVRSLLCGWLAGLLCFAVCWWVGACVRGALGGGGVD